MSSKPGGKVVHLNDELHSRLKRYCISERASMKEWIEEMITMSLDICEDIDLSMSRGKDGKKDPSNPN
jgi:hypothetical protein